MKEQAQESGRVCGACHIRMGYAEGEAYKNPGTGEKMWVHKVDSAKGPCLRLQEALPGRAELIDAFRGKGSFVICDKPPLTVSTRRSEAATS